MKGLQHLFNLFYPDTCVCCDQYLLDQEKIICIECRLDLPFIETGNSTYNPLLETLKGKVFVEEGTSFLYYHPEGKVKKLIHQLKYKNNQKVGIFLGKWLGLKLLETKAYNSIDYIIPVPLHKDKLRLRGYNQLTKFGETLSSILNIEYLEGVLIRNTMAKTQTLKKRLDRFKSLVNNFSLINADLLKNKHVLLIDDVVTTGATLEACCNELLKVEGMKISIVTIALTE
ncbi:MAG: ComF family protein [Flavobacteriaceae bacterium]